MAQTFKGIARWDKQAHLWYNRTAEGEVMNNNYNRISVLVSTRSCWKRDEQDGLGDISEPADIDRDSRIH